MLRLDWILAWVCDLHFVVKTAMLDDRSKNRTIRGNGRHTCSMVCHACERWRFHETHSCQLDAFILWNLPCPVQRLKSMGGNTDSGVRRCGQRIYACEQVVFLSVIGFEGKKDHNGSVIAWSFTASVSIELKKISLLQSIGFLYNELNNKSPWSHLYNDQIS